MKIPASLYFNEVDTSRPFEPMRIAESTWRRTDPEPVLAVHIVATEEEIERERMRPIPGHTPAPPRILCFDDKAYLVSDHSLCAQMIARGDEIIQCLVVPLVARPAAAFASAKTTRR